MGQEIGISTVELRILLACDACLLAERLFYKGGDVVEQGNAGSPGSDGASPYLPNRARDRNRSKG
jgi:hypothetical protein